MSIGQDLQFALRQLRKSPGFAITAVLTLALGVGAAAAVFSVLDAVMLKPLPFHEPERIIVPETISKEGYTQPFAYPSYKDARAWNHTLSALAGYFPYGGINLESPSGPVALHSVETTDNFFDVFGVKPLIGRTFLPDENPSGKTDVAVLSDEVWRANFNGDRSLIGKAIRLDGRPYTVIGVMPSDFRFPLGMRNAVYTPLHSQPKWLTSRGTHWLRTVGRLKPGVTREQAQADMDRVFADLGRAYPDTDAGRKAHVHSLAASLTAEVRSPLWTLSFAVLAVLGIACVNVSSLLLARGVKREREMAMRAAVGASRGRLMGQVLTESLTLAAFGAVSGILFAFLLLQALRTYLVHGLDRGGEIQMNLPVLLVAIVLATGASVLAALLPAARLAATDPNRALKAGGSAGTGRGQHRLRSAFIVTQVALALVLLFTSGLLLQSISRTRHEELGFDPSHIAAAEIDLSPGRYAGKDVVADFYEPFLQKVEHLPGVAAAGWISITPIQSYGSNSDVHIKGQPPSPPNQETLAEYRVVSPKYFETMGTHLVRGRLLDTSIDTNPEAPSIVVNEAFVKKLIPAGLNPIGQHIDDGNAEIVGVVSDVRQALERKPMAEMDYLYSQIPVKDRQQMLTGMNLIIRAQLNPQTVYGEVREALRQIDPTVPFRAPETMNEIIIGQLSFQSMEAWLFGIFAGLALLLSAIGLYGLVSHEVELSTRDIGVRMALGASRGRVLGAVLSRTALMVAAGIGAGALLTLIAQRGIAAVVPVVSGRDVLSFVVFAAALFAIGIASVILPAYRVAQLEPMQALRNE